MVERIRSLCTQRKLTIRSLETALGFANNTIAKWDVNRPSVDRAVAVADFFGVTVEFLTKGTN